MRAFLAALVVLPYDQRVVTRWGEIQAYAQLRGRPRPVNDSWIAACCLVRALPLATFSIKDYADFTEHEGLELVHRGHSAWKAS
jgi:predicted nucleic acid-binding protein